MDFCLPKVNKSVIMEKKGFAQLKTIVKIQREKTVFFD